MSLVRCWNKMKKSHHQSCPGASDPMYLDTMSKSASKRKEGGSRKQKKKVSVVAPAPQLSDDDDTDLEYDEDALLHRIHKDRSNCKQMYEAACRHYDVVVSSQFISHMKGSRVQLTDLALGPLDIKTMCIPLLYNTTVSVLDFSGNNLGNKGVVHVMDMLKENVHIQELHLARNNISKSGARCICEGLANNHKIRKLNLSGNLLRDNEAKYFAELLRSNSIIKILDLSNNHLGEESGEVLGSVIAENGALEELDLSWNHIRLHGAVALARSLRDNDTLKRLDVSWNGFTNAGAAEMGQALSENFTLKELNMNSNRINLVGLGPLAKGINTNEGLKTLKLGGNPILALGAEMILQVIQQSETSKVVSLDIEHVPISYNFAATLEELNQERVNLKVKHDCKIRHADDLGKQQGSLSGDPLRILSMYVRERGIYLTDWLISCPECPEQEMCVDEMPFRAAIRKLNAPLNEIQIEGLAKRLHKLTAEEQVLGVDISSLVNHEDYRQKRNAYLDEMEERSRALALIHKHESELEENLPEKTTLAVDGAPDDHLLAPPGGLIVNQDDVSADIARQATQERPTSEQSDHKDEQSVEITDQSETVINDDFEQKSVLAVNENLNDDCDDDENEET